MKNRLMLSLEHADPAPHVLLYENTQYRQDITDAGMPDDYYRLSDNPFLTKIRLIVEQCLPDSIGVNHLAKALFCSRIQVFRKTKILTGQSPSCFVRTIRLQKAFELLRTTDLPITEIAYTVGFNDPKYFTRVFTAAFGETPSKSRMKLSTWTE